MAGSTHLFRVPLTGGAVEQVTRGSRRLADASIAWDAQRVAYVAGDATHPAEVHVAALDGSGERKLSRSTTRCWRRSGRGRPSRVRFTEQGRHAVEGWLILPDVGRPRRIACRSSWPFTAGRTAPTATTSRCSSSAGRRRLRRALHQPARLDRYGEKFLWDTWGGWGGRDYEDVMAGVDHVLARYPVDAKRLGVTGYSYGGFLTNWVITQTQRFRPPIVGAGISNWSATTAPPTSRAPRRASSAARRGRPRAARRCSSGRR